MAQIKFITAEQTLPIRQSVLRPGRPEKECNLDGDDAPQTFHLGIFTEEKLVGIASYVVDKHTYFSGKQYRLRGMAVLPQCHGKGYGKQLVDHGEKCIQQEKFDILWFNAREVAFNFYKGLGFIAKGDPFEIPNVGTHYVMFKELS